MGGWMNQATRECLGQKSKSSYLWEDGRTKLLMSALVNNLSPSIYGVDGRTNQATHEYLGQ